MQQSVRASLDALEPDARDEAARELARTYAAQIDADPDLLAELGPRLHAVLESLGLTPKSRAAATRGGTGGPARNPLDQLRDRRARRDGTAPVDSPAS